MHIFYVGNRRKPVCSSANHSQLSWLNKNLFVNLGSRAGGLNSYQRSVSLVYSYTGVLRVLSPEINLLYLTLTDHYDKQTATVIITETN